MFLNVKVDSCTNGILSINISNTDKNIEIKCLILSFLYNLKSILLVFLVYAGFIKQSQMNIFYQHESESYMWYCGQYVVFFALSINHNDNLTSYISAYQTLDIRKF